ncbi:MAG TPA: hypothetical protein VF817_04825 [Patescibacteria group bacterium]
MFKFEMAQHPLEAMGGTRELIANGTAKEAKKLKQVIKGLDSCVFISYIGKFGGHEINLTALIFGKEIHSCKLIYQIKGIEKSIVRYGSGSWTAVFERITSLRG